MASVLVPVLYLAVLIGSLLLFSSVYRKRAAAKTIEPYFPSHPERNFYITLLGKTDPPPSDALVKAALIRRAMTDVQRVVRIREDKPALQNLLQKGSIGDDLWNSLLAAEKELEAEILEVMAEANSFREGWGPIIFPTASEMVANERTRGIYEGIPAVRAEKEPLYGGKRVAAIAAPASPAAVRAPPNTPATPVTPVTPTTPATPITPSIANRLAPPVNGGVESESERSPSPTTTTMSARSSAKKSKKRK